jgi:hypothetical protein
MFTTFYKELDEARKEVGDEKFADFCFYELKISLSILLDTSNILKKSDRGVIKMQWAEARKIEKEVKRAEVQKEREERQVTRVSKQVESSHALSAKTKVQREKQRNDKKEKLVQAGPSNPILAQHLANCKKIEAEIQIEHGEVDARGRLRLGREYAACKDIVQRFEAGTDIHRHPWSWSSWVKVYIPERTKRAIDQCIADWNRSNGGKEIPVEESEKIVKIYQNRVVNQAVT